MAPYVVIPLSEVYYSRSVRVALVGQTKKWRGASVLRK